MSDDKQVFQPPYRTDARTIRRIELLEEVRVAATKFLYALRTDPGYPKRREETMASALALLDIAEKSADV